MQWEFRKVLQSFETYKVNSHSFIAEVEKGTHGVLTTLVRQIQHIISGVEEKIITKVLAMRFAKDIMILGRADVINALTKIVPHMLKICSYKLQDDSPDRGQTFFNTHSTYLKASQQEKRDIERYASTYFILTLQSIWHWANWIPADENGKESIYAQGYNSLKERGVVFQTNFHYYKDSDTQRFKNTYRVQFFTESSFMDYESNSQSMMTSKIENDEMFSNKSVKSNKSKTSSKVSQRQLNSVQNIKIVLQNISQDKKQHWNKIGQINKKLQTIMEVKYSNDLVKYKGSQKQEKKWIQKYIINYGLLKGNKITYDEFIKRTTSQIIDLSIQVESMPIEDGTNFKKKRKSAKMQTVQKQKQQYEEILLKTQNDYKRRMQGLISDRQNHCKEVEKIKKGHEEEKSYIINEYENRIQSIKRGITQNGGDKTQYLIKENEKLKQKINEFERSFKENYREEELQRQRNKLYRQIQLLKIDNEKLRVMNSTQKYEKKIKFLQKKLQQRQRQKSEESSVNESVKNKHLHKLNDEVNLYKQQLTIEREKWAKKQKSYDKRILELQFQNNELKQNVGKLKKKLDLKDMQTVQLSQQVRLFKVFDKEGCINMPSQHTNQKLVKQKEKDKERTFKYKKYQGLRNEYKNHKELFLRFCRCCMKKKDIIMKQNELQIGLISEVISQMQIKFILHFTNVSEHQFQNLQISIDKPNYIDVEMSTTFVFCIQRQQQQKITIRCKTQQNLTQNYKPISLSLTYGKNKQMYTSQLNLPFLGFKALQLYKPQSKNLSKMLSKSKETIGVYYSKKMLPELKYLKTFFQNLQETSSTIFECQAYNRAQKFLMRVCFQFTGQNFVIIEVIPVKEEGELSRKEQQIIFDLISFMEFTFKK